MVVSAPLSARGIRLDKFLAQSIDGVSRSRVQQLIDEGHVRIAGKAVKARLVLQGGEAIDVYLPPPEPVSLAAEDIPLTVLYEDADVCVIDKPAGLTVHPSQTQKKGTLVNALLHRLHDLSGIGGELRPGIVHRLDKDTSGVLIIAKHDKAHRFLSEQFSGRTVKKIYIAVVIGVTPERGEWTKPIGRHPTDRKKFSTHGGKPAHTRFVRRAVLADMFSELEIELLTGRTHQIRVHASDAGFPLVGDKVYGKKRVPEIVADFPRQALHAHRLTLTLPSGKERTFEAPIPPDMAALIDKLSDRRRR